ncbi:MAG: CD225/dispanin family protein [Terracoccus sp.]
MSNDWSTAGPERDPQRAPAEFWTPRPDPTRDRQSAWSDEVPPPVPTRAQLPPTAWADRQAWPPPTRPSPMAPPPPSYAVLPPPPNHLVWAVLFTFFGFFPFGIVAVIRASTVRPLWAQGQWAESIAASRSARRWVIAAVLTIPAFLLSVTTLFMVGAAIT